MRSFRVSLNYVPRAGTLFPVAQVKHEQQKAASPQLLYLHIYTCCTVCLNSPWWGHRLLQRRKQTVTSSALPGTLTSSMGTWSATKRVRIPGWPQLRSCLHTPRRTESRKRNALYLTRSLTFFQAQGCACDLVSLLVPHKRKWKGCKQYFRKNYHRSSQNLSVRETAETYFSSNY